MEIECICCDELRISYDRIYAKTRIDSRFIKVCIIEKSTIIDIFMRINNGCDRTEYRRRIADKATIRNLYFRGRRTPDRNRIIPENCIEHSNL